MFIQLAMAKKSHFFPVREPLKKSFRKIFPKILNIDLEHSSLLHCNTKTLYYIWLEGFSLEIIFRTVMVGLNFPATRNFYTVLARGKKKIFRQFV